VVWSKASFVHLTSVTKFTFDSQPPHFPMCEHSMSLEGRACVREFRSM
jgi:hypothetical protein